MDSGLSFDVAQDEALMLSFVEARGPTTRCVASNVRWYDTAE